MDGVLVVDDDPINLQVVEYLLTANGYRVFQAADGDGALETLRNHLADIALILLDVTLPQESGFDVCDAIRNKISAEVPVLMFSCRKTASDETRAVEVGADGYVLKPFERAELLKTLKETIIKGKARRPSASSVMRVPEAVLAVAVPPGPLITIVDITTRDASQSEIVMSSLAAHGGYLISAEPWAPLPLQHRFKAAFGDVLQSVLWAIALLRANMTVHGCLASDADSAERAVDGRYTFKGDAVRNCARLFSEADHDLLVCANTVQMLALQASCSNDYRGVAVLIYKEHQLELHRSPKSAGTAFSVVFVPA